MEKEIGNKLIAEFMGAVDETGYFQASTIGKTKVPTGRIYMTNRFPNNMHLIKESELAYHTSWNWLMPVVQKIESIGFTVSIFKGCCDIEANGNPEFGTIQNGGGQPKIYSTWLSVIEFIKWYNSVSCNTDNLLK